LPKSNEESAICIKFSLISNPPKFQVDSSLQRIVGMKKGTRIAILDAFWQYIKENKLQDV
jgi:chromatin remodeling complex protein RSC6